MTGIDVHTHSKAQAQIIFHRAELNVLSFDPVVCKTGEDLKEARLSPLYHSAASNTDPSGLICIYSIYPQFSAIIRVAFVKMVAQGPTSN